MVVPALINCGENREESLARLQRNRWVTLCPSPRRQDQGKAQNQRKSKP